ncbi:CrcB family protein [Paenibacillus sp.]|uniref:fluoride efflux transporter FluC n=1 Tax=Paenibacillus sp. TaxID=58172 RepID=UPI0028128E0A|nr:CrcB family protein [Paenibacillus sp.]
MRYGWIAAGGAAGAVSRWGLGVWLAPASAGGFPYATLAANLIGAYALGWMSARFSAEDKSSAAYQGAASGFLGAFTTMSAFGLEAWTLLADGRYVAAATYAAASACAGPLLANAGLRAGGAS